MGGGQVPETPDAGQTEELGERTARPDIPRELAEIPEKYWTPMENGGRLERLDYTTFEAFHYAEGNETLTKTTYVYLPAGYDENKSYDIFYLMHGGWSNETTQLGTPERPSGFKHVLDHAIADGKLRPILVVCPTYNNTSPQDSGSYTLALQLTDLYHQELINDLLPAVESRYATYAVSTDQEGIRASRDHRGFGGLSMGSVTTWHTFEHCLEGFRYFLPMSGSGGTLSAQRLAQAVEDSGLAWNDFFIYAISGEGDFAYSSFKGMVEAMGEMEPFRMADNEETGNLAFRETTGASHSAEFAYRYTYNGLVWFWGGEDG